jgi:hypothetical protein
VRGGLGDYLVGEEASTNWRVRSGTADFGKGDKRFVRCHKFCACSPRPVCLMSRTTESRKLSALDRHAERIHGNKIVKVPQGKQPVTIVALVGEREFGPHLFLSSYIEFESEILLELGAKFGLDTSHVRSETQPKRACQFLAALH